VIVFCGIGFALEYVARRASRKNKKSRMALFIFGGDEGQRLIIK
jgi:hypothetical protein